jgi:acyl-CoA synthetase (AMP-forming)/AMP-acid ligase II
VSGIQVSPKEIEDILFAYPEKLISDVSVAGVSGGRTDDEKVPRAWIVLSSAGTKKGAPAVIKVLEKWHQESLSKHKWLRGGIEVVDEVRIYSPASGSLGGWHLRGVQIPKTPTGKNKRRVLQDEYERRLKGTKAKL